MIYSIFRIFSALMIFIITMEPSLAQDTKDENQGRRSYQCTALNEWKGPPLYVKTGKNKHVELELCRMAYTQSFLYKPNNPVVFYEKKIGTDGQAIFVKSLSISIPKLILNPMLAFYWNIKQRPAVKIVEFSEKIFPYGSYQVVNLSPVPLAGYIGKNKKKYICKAHRERIIQPDLSHGDRAPIVFFAKEKGEIRTVFSTMTIHRSQKRVILFLSRINDSFNQKCFSSQSLVDFKQQEQKVKSK